MRRRQKKCTAVTSQVNACRAVCQALAVVRYSSVVCASCPSPLYKHHTAKCSTVRPAKQMQNGTRNDVTAYRHWPMMTVSPSLTRKHGDTCAATLLCRFSYLRSCANHSYMLSCSCARQCAAELAAVQF